MLGGYQMIKANFDLAVDEAQTDTGLNARLNSALQYNKPIVLNGVLYEDDILSPIYVGVTRRALNGIMMFYSNYLITVSNDDKVTVQLLGEV